MGGLILELEKKVVVPYEGCFEALATKFGGYVG